MLPFKGSIKTAVREIKTPQTITVLKHLCWSDIKSAVATTPKYLIWSTTTIPKLLAQIRTLIKIPLLKCKSVPLNSKKGRVWRLLSKNLFQLLSKKCSILCDPLPISSYTQHWECVLPGFVCDLSTWDRKTWEIAILTFQPQSSALPLQAQTWRMRRSGGLSYKRSLVTLRYKYAPI